MAVAVAAFGVAVCYIASGFRTGTFPDPITPRGLPYLAGGFMVLGGTVLVARRMIRWRAFPRRGISAEGIADEPGYPASAARSLIAMATALAWALLLEEAGFLLVTPPAMLVWLWMMNIRSAAMLLGFSVGFPLVVWSVFALVLGVGIPLGPFNEIARSLGIAV